MIKPTKEGVQLCLGNAERLFADSKGTSEPTRVALLELALEECAKAWMMWMALWVNDTGSPAKLAIIEFGKSAARDLDSTLDAASQASVVAELKDRLPRLMNPPLKEAFEHHRVKLAYIEELVAVLSIIAPLVPDIHYPPDLMARTAVGRPDFPERIPIEKVHRVRQVLDQFREHRITELSGSKESGFYVDLDSDGSLVAPSGLLFKISGLEDLVSFLLVGLKGISRIR